MEEERLCLLFLFLVVYYLDYECSIVVEKLKDDFKFLEVVQILFIWIE